MISEALLLNSIDTHRKNCAEKYGIYLALCELLATEDVDVLEVVREIVKNLLYCQDELQKALYSYDVLTGNLLDDKEYYLEFISDVDSVFISDDDSDDCDNCYWFDAEDDEIFD